MQDYAEMLQHGVSIEGSEEGV